MKEFLSARGVDFVSINVREDATGLARLTRAGVRGLPTVARGDQYVSGIDLAAVAELAGLPYAATPMLGAAELVERYVRVLDAAMGFTRQIPKEHLHDRLPHRDRSYLALSNHLVQIAVGFIEVARGADLSERLAAATPESNLAPAALRIRSRRAQQDLRRWLRETSAAQLQRRVATYYGEQTLHQVLERCVWHSAQHARQLMMVLELLGIAAHDPLNHADLAGLPVPDGVWDA